MNNLMDQMRLWVDQQIGLMLETPLLDCLAELKNMLAWQLGMDGTPGSEFARGKRIRPLLLLLTAYAQGGNWENTLSAAAAVELMHNFSLIHDDIEDGSELRRGRPTVWVKWGTAQAINAGDAMLGLAQLAVLRDAENMPAKDGISLFRRFNRTLLELTGGQHLDLVYEGASELNVHQYDRMVAGKTGALLAACFEMGAVAGGAEASQVEQMFSVGRAVGRAFQIQDDWLGIWGSEQVTGKSSRSDLLVKKKTFPVVMGLESVSDFKSLWQRNKKIDLSLANSLADLLAESGMKELTEEEFNQEYDLALKRLQGLDLVEGRVQPLRELLLSMRNRSQ